MFDSIFFTAFYLYVVSVSLTIQYFIKINLNKTEKFAFVNQKTSINYKERRRRKAFLKKFIKKFRKPNICIYKRKTEINFDKFISKVSYYITFLNVFIIDLILLCSSFVGICFLNKAHFISVRLKRAIFKNKLVRLFNFMNILKTNFNEEKVINKFLIRKN